MTSQRNLAWLFWSLCTLIVAWGALYIDAPLLKLASGALLSLFFPGHALARWVAGRRDVDPVEQACLALGLSLLASTLVAYGLFLSLPGVRHVDAVTALAATSVLLYVGGRSSQPRYAWERHHIAVLLLVAFAAFFRLAFLGYAELQGDEAENVLSCSLRLLNGDVGVLFANRRPPTQVLLSSLHCQLAGGFRETAMRLPFAVAGVAIVAVVYLVARRLFSTSVAVMAGLLTTISGYAVAFSRMLQYQTVVVLSAALVVLHVLHLREMSAPERNRRSLCLAFVFLGFAGFTHYEGFLIAPVLIPGIRWVMGRAGTASTWRLLALATALCVGIMVLFYVPFLLGESSRTVMAFYKGTRFGGAWLHFNKNTFWYSAGPYNSYPFLVFTVVAALAGMIRAPSTARNILMAWFVPSFLVFMVIMSRPNTHIQNFFYPLFLFAAAGCAWVFERVGRVFARSKTVGLAIRTGLMGGFLVLSAFTVHHVYYYFVSHQPEQVWTAPQKARPQYGIFGYPYHRGWKTVGYLFRTGELRGSYKSNEKFDITDFYLRQAQARQVKRPDYFVAVQRPQSWSPVPSRMLETDYTRIAEIVDESGATPMEIYRRKDLSTGGMAEVRRFRDDDFEQAYFALDIPFPAPIQRDVR